MTYKTSNVLALSALTLAMSAPALAVDNGSNVAAADYEDYVLNVKLGSNNCGGALLGAQYFLTAKHCITGTTGSTGTMTYGQTINESDAVNTVGYTVVLTGEDNGLGADWVSKADDHYNNVLKVADAGLFGYSLQDNFLSKDYALLKLDKAIGHSTGALLSPLYDFDNSISYLPLDTDMTFRGWGVDAQGSTHAAMQTMNFKTMTQWQQAWTNGTDAGNVFDADVGTDVPVICTQTTYNGVTGDLCTWNGQDTIDLYVSGDKSSLTGGDSGTPISYNNRILGIAKSSFGEYSDSFQHFTYSLDHFVSAINGVLYPTAQKTVTSGATGTQSFTIAVQNFTNVDQTFVPSLVDSTGQFSADVSGCAATIASKDGCVMTATFNPNGAAITSTFSAEIDMGNGNSVPLSVVPVAADTNTGNTGSTGGSSGGGSLGFFGLFGLALLAFRRNKK